MASPDRRRANQLYARARFLALCAIGFITATLIYPSRPYMLPSTALAIIAAGSGLFVLAVANYFWWRDR